MRIAVVHSFYRSSQPSGENVVVEDQIAALRSANHDVLSVDRRSDTTSTSRTFAARAAWTTATGYGSSPEDLLSGFNAEVVHVHNTFPNWGTRWIRKWGPKTVATLHNYRSHCSAGTFFRGGQECKDCLVTPVVPAIAHGCYANSRMRTVPLALATRPGGSLNMVARQAARIVVLNTEAEGVFTASLGRAVDLVPNFVAASNHVARSNSRFLYAGRLSVEKGVHDLVDGWPQAESLDIFGEGPIGEVLRGATANNRTVEFYGAVPRSELLSRLPRYRGLVVPSQWSEGIPTVLLEALACGVPLVLSDRMSVTSAFVESGAAVAYSPSRPESLAAALRRVRDRTKEMRSAALKFHAREFSQEVWLKRMAGIYSDVLASSKP